MKKWMGFVLVLAVTAALTAGGCREGDKKSPAGDKKTTAQAPAKTAKPAANAAENPASANLAKQVVYVCPMHPEVTSTDPNATCPKCGMKLEPRPGDAGKAKPTTQPEG